MLGKVLFILFVPAFIAGQFARIELGNGVAITAIDLVVGLIALYVLLSRGIRNTILKHALFRPVTIFVGVCTFSLLINSLFMQPQEAIVASLYLARWICYAALLFISLSMEKQFTKLMMICLGIGVVGVGYLQYFFFNSLKPLFPLGWDEHMYRMVGGFLDPNFAGAFYVLFFIYLLSIIFPFRSKHISREGIFLGFAAGMTLIAVYLTFSRSALLMLVVGLGTLLLLTKQVKLLLVSIASIFILFGLFADTAVESRNPFRVFSSEARITSAKEALTLISKSPVIGVGFNAYRYGQRRFGLPTDEKLYASHSEAGTDNSFLFITATTGVVGLLLFIYLIWHIVQFARTDTNGYWANVKVAAIIGLCINSFFINSLFFPMILGFLWLWLGTTESKKL